jgi:hypothetical protein
MSFAVSIRMSKSSSPVFKMTEIFGQPTALTSFELEECRHRAERIRLLGQELDRIGRMAIQGEQFRRAS